MNNEPDTYEFYYTRREDGKDTVIELSDHPTSEAAAKRAAILTGLFGFVVIAVAVGAPVLLCGVGR